jgi:ferric-dicitrate binding protein FerR (iron transport regulator)
MRWRRAKKPKSRKLRGEGSGAFRTRGQYSVATVRGTKWLVQDSCAGTRTRVAKGVVSVRDEVKRETLVLRAGKSYLATPRR